MSSSDQSPDRLTHRKTVFVASPFHGEDPQEKLRFQSYTRRAIKDSLRRMEAPFAPHFFYPRFLDDRNEAQRLEGMCCGISFLKGCDLFAAYVDHGMSPGMIAEMQYAVDRGVEVELRRILKR